MINAVNSTISPKKPAFQSIFYVNDIHGQLPRMEQIANAATQFDSFVKMNKVDSLKVSAGDQFIGQNQKINKAAAAFLDAAGIEATAAGNHEFDNSASVFSKLMSTVKTKILGANCHIPDDSPLKNQVTRSMIKTEPNGNKYGVIGAQSKTLIDRMKDKSLFEGITITGQPEAYKEIQEEVDKLREQGINKIVLLSHSGYEEEKLIAQNVSGIDVIIGGHSHDLIKGIEEGKNLFYSPEGEPVIITQAGRDGHYFGVLNVQYDEDGVISAAQNNVIKTAEYENNFLMSSLADKMLGTSPVVANLKSQEALPENINIEENGYADVFADIVRKETDADVVLINSANFRGCLKEGKITERDLSSIFPFKNALYKVQISEKDIVDALNHGGSSLTSPDGKPSIVQVSGLEYSLSKDGKVTKATFVDKNGQKSPLNVENPDENKTFTAVYDDYLLKGGDGFKSLKTDKIIENYGYDKDQVAINYFKKAGSNMEFEIKKDNRITFEK